MKELTDQLARDGFYLPEVRLDANIIRFDRNGHKNNAWFIGFQNHTVKGGEPYIYCLYGDWTEIYEEPKVWTSRKLSKADQVASKAQYDAVKRKALEEKKIKQKEAAEKAVKKLATAQDKGLTPYCKRKNIDQLYGCKVLDFDTLLVPVKDINGSITGLQFINEDGEKKFLTGSKIDGCFHQIGEIETEVLICEGFATGATLHKATGKPVVIAFNAGNLVAVAKEIRSQYPDISISICGDDDRFTEKNPGRFYAEKAARMAHGGIIFPKFQGEDSKGTDFNDLAQSEGIETVKKQLTSEPTIVTGFIPLGYDESTYFFYNCVSNDIVKIGTFAKHQLFQIAPKDFWEEKYPNSKEGGEANWTQAINDLIQICRRVGPFDSARIRGTGVWIDKDRIVVNTGHCLVVDGREMNLSSIDSWYIYVQTRNRIPPLAEPLDVKKSKILADLCESFAWRDKKSGALLAGWLAIARVAGAFPIRPHIWLTGGAGTGKTTLMDQLISPALGCAKAKIHLQGASTEAGIRQRLKSSSVPVIFDEFETTGEHSKTRIQSCLELLRVSWSSKSGAVVKGSAEGHSVEYQVAFSALVSSIRVNLENDADRSRFSILELMHHGNKIDEWEIIRKNLLKIDETYGEQLFARSITMVRTIIASQKVFNSVLAGVMSQRYGQQVGTLLAGYWSLLSDDPIDLDTAKSIVDELGQSQDEIEDLQTTDERECLDYILSYRFQVRRADGAMEYKDIREVIEDTSMFQDDYIKSIRGYGILLRKNKNQWEMLVAYRGSELTKIFRLTRWSTWSITLSRLDGSRKTSFRKGSDHITAICIKI